MSKLETFEQFMVAAEVAELCALREVDPETGKVSEASSRKELLAKYRAGELYEIEIDAIVTRDPIKPSPLPEDMADLANANFTRFREDEITELASSFERRPFLRDHSSRLADRAGTIIASSSAEEDGEHVMRQTIRVVKPWAIEGVLDETLEEFSIGWQPQIGGFEGYRRSAYCTVCDLPIMNSDCDHYPGDRVKLAGSDARVIVELQWRDVKGKETSAVTFPAVQGTGIEEFTAALSEAKTLSRGKTPMGIDKVKLAEALGSDASSSEAEILAEVSGMAGRLATSKVQLAAAEESRNSMSAALEAERSERRAEVKARQDAEIKTIRDGAISSRLWLPASKREALFDKLAAADIESARQYVDTLEPDPSNPIAVPMQYRGEEPDREPAPGSSDLAGILSESYGKTSAQDVEIVSSQLKQLGLSEADFAKHGQHTRE